MAGRLDGWPARRLAGWMAQMLCSSPMPPNDEIPPEAEAWLEAMKKDIEGMSAEERAEIARREARIKGEIDAIEAGWHPLCHQPAA